MFGAITKALLALWIMTWAGHAQAQWKTIPCSDLKFTAGIKFTDCQYERSLITLTFQGGHVTTYREIYGGYFHDENSSLAAAVYTSDKGVALAHSESYALGAEAYRPFLEKYPNRAQIVSQGKWISFPAVVKAPTGNRTMNCLQFFKGGPVRASGYSWTMVALMCIRDGEVPESAADLILNSIQVNLK
jgi:hypothetical protein